MKLSYKDKSLIIFLVALLIVIYSIFSLASFLFQSAPTTNSKTKLISQVKKEQLININQTLSKNLLKNRLIILDFWNYSCISCLENIEKIKKLEERFGNKILFIGVHSSKFQNEKRLSAVKKAVIRYDITHPVIHDIDQKLYKAFDIKAFPTLVLITPKGKIYKKYQGQEAIKDIKSDIKKVISKNKFSINREYIKHDLIKFENISNVLSFPTKVIFVEKFSYKNHKNLPALFISNSATNNIIVSSLAGKIITKIGSSERLLADGNFDNSAFNMPLGLVYHKDKLYVADSGNHAIRVVDFKKEKVTTLIGNAHTGSILEFKKPKAAKDINLYFPSDLDIHQKNLIISNLGSNQILSYDFSNKKIKILAGNGKNKSVDGKYPNNSLAKPSDIASYKDKIYFLDSASSSLRYIDNKGKVKTLIGNNNVINGFKDGTKDQAMMQNPLGLDVNSTGIYITDSFNHSVRKYSFANKRLNTIIGSKVGNKVGKPKQTRFDEPSGIFVAKHDIYIADTNNNRIIQTNLHNLSSKVIDIIPQLKLPKKSFVQYLPNLQINEKVNIKSNKIITLEIDIAKKWKLNSSAPSFINLLKITSKNEADLVSSFDWQEIENKKLKLPKLQNKKRYILQGVIYHCENKENALCFVKSYEQRILADKNSKNEKITIKLGK